MAGDAGDELVDGAFELGFGQEGGDQAQFEGALGGDGFSGQNNFEGALGADEKRKDGGSERRKNADGDFRLREAGFGRGDDQIAEGGQFRATADGRTVDDADHGLADFEHAGKGGLKGFEHLVHALRGVLADVNAAAEDFARGVDDDELNVIVISGEGDAVGDFAKHGFIE